MIHHCDGPWEWDSDLYEWKCTCIEGYHFKQGTEIDYGDCYPCQNFIEGCTTCSNIHRCDACEAGKMLNKDLSGCIDIIPHCEQSEEMVF